MFIFLLLKLTHACLYYTFIVCVVVFFGGGDDFEEFKSKLFKPVHRWEVHSSHLSL